MTSTARHLVERRDLPGPCHLSSNVFTNTLISELTRALWYAGAAGLAIGALAGWFLRRPGPRIQ
jgi:hypothetical protein